MTVFSLIFLILLLGDLVWCWNLHVRLRPLPSRKVAEAGLFVFTGIQVTGLLLLFLGRRLGFSLESSLGKPMVAGVYLWHCLVLLPMVFLWCLGKVAHGILRLSRLVAGLGRAAPAPTLEAPPSRDMSRRQFVSAAVWAAPALATVGATGLASTQWNHFRIRRLEVTLPQLPSALDGLTIAHVADLHVGNFTHGAILDDMVTATNQLHADLVLVAGDLINYSLADLPAALGVVTRLQPAHGVFVCEGNHDLFEDPAEFRRQVRAAGIRLLINAAATFSVRGAALQILGLQWGWGQGDPRASSNRGDAAIAHSMKELLTQRQASAFPILLAHHPHAFDYAQDIPLTLAGHTHGGQLMFSREIGFGPAMFRYWSGLYRKAEQALVVSNGVGNWFPLRVQAPAEIIHLTLRRG